MLTTLLVSMYMVAAPQIRDDKSADQCFRFIFEAVMEGMKNDGMPRELANKIADNPKDFVEKCTICAAVHKGMYEYSRQVGPPTGSGITDEMIRRLENSDDRIRREAIKDLVGRYIDRAYAAKKMTPAQQHAMQRIIAQEREWAMPMKPGEMEYCPSCEGGSCQLPPDDKAYWGDPHNGVVSRLSLVTRNPQVGKKLRLRLEVKNTGTIAAKFDDQQSRVNNSLSIKGPNGKSVPYIALSFQTMGHSEQLGPNQEKTVFADMDASKQYLFEMAGEYTIQFVGRGGIPKSNELKVTLKDGQLSDLQTMVLALQKVVPNGWRVTTNDDSITILNTPTNLKRDATSVSIFFTKTKEHGQQLGPNQVPLTYLLETRNGHAWLQPQDQQVALRWENFEKVIKEQVSAFKKTDG